MTELGLAGVELRRHADVSYPVESDGFEPYAHQIDLNGLFETGDGLLAVNDSPTGGGKTMSWLSATVQSGDDTLAIYPTNALIQDQYDAITDELDEHFPSKADDIAVLRVTAETLRNKHADAYPRADRNGERLQRLLDDHLRRGGAEQTLVLTNPDIFVMMRRNLYGQSDAGSLVRGLNEFETIVLDEFHRAGRKEQNSLLFLLDEMYDAASSQIALSRIVLLSATPTDRLETRFDAMSAPYTRLSTQRETTERREYDETPSEGWAPVMPPVDVDIRQAETFGTAEQLLEEWDETREFAARDGQTVFILDGIHEVEQVHTRLSEAFPERDIVRVDGFHRGDLQAKLRDFDVLVSNSAVEVGIDFNVDRLLFSAANTASFVQRLGRLRSKSDPHTARCYVPTSVHQELSDLADAEERCSRDTLIKRLEQSYNDPQEVESFDWRYSAAEAYYHLGTRQRHDISEQKEAISEAGWERITRHFASEADLSRSDLERRVDAISPALSEPLQWYRGASLQAMVYDRTAEPGEQVKAYDLFYLLRYGIVTFYQQSAFKDILPETASTDRYEPFVSAYCTFDGTISTDEDGYGRDVLFEPKSEIYAWLQNEPEKNRVPRAIQEISVAIDDDPSEHRITSLDTLRETLDSGDNRMLCYVVDGSPGKTKRQYNLGSFFFLRGLKHPDGIKSLAAGTDALYLHCLHEDAQSGFDDIPGVDL